MAFALTKYIYPLEKHISFFKVPNYSFDNARSPEEISFIKNFISRTLQIENSMYKEHNDQLVRVLLGIKELTDFLRSNDKDSYALKYYESNLKKDLIDILAETWIIVRFDDENNFEKIISTDRDNQLLFLIEKTKSSSYKKNFENLVNISHVISLLANDEVSYYGETFLLTKNPIDIFYNIERLEISPAYRNFIGSCFSLKEGNRAKQWKYWLDGKDSIMAFAEKLNVLYLQPPIRIKNEKIRHSQKQSPSEKILHLGKYLRMANDHVEDPELSLILLVSILEFLVTKKQETNEGNSITKQFKLKCTILINSQNNTTQINELSKTLGEIYELRSDLAHGNYIDNYNVAETTWSVFTLFQFIKDILNSYIKNRELIEYLKDN